MAQLSEHLLEGRLWVRSPTKDTKTCQLHCTPVSISNAGYSGLSPNCIPEYLSATKYTKLHCRLPGISVRNPGYSGLLHEVYTRISISNKVYEVLPATLHPDVSVSNLGYTLRVYRYTGISVSNN